MRERYDQRYPHIGGMTSITSFRGLWMSSGFISSRADTVMTPCTITRLPGHRGMVKQNLQPVGGVVAHITRFAGDDVGLAFTGGDGAVMTVFTQVGGLGVIDGNGKGSPAGTGGMTKFTSIGSDWMRCRLIGGVSAGVTGGTGVGGLIVRERY